MRYAAPVAADRVVDGFVLSLAYATSVDWLRNVLTAGEATITTSGETNHVVEPEIIDAAKVSTESRLGGDLAPLGIDKFVKLKLMK